jgi:hypothetical protein
MTNPWALSPFPNAIFWDWATIFILGFGNLAALDFQAGVNTCPLLNSTWAHCVGYVRYLQ